MELTDDLDTSFGKHHLGSPLQRRILVTRGRGHQLAHGQCRWWLSARGSLATGTASRRRRFSREPPAGRSIFICSFVRRRPLLPRHGTDRGEPPPKQEEKRDDTQLCVHTQAEIIAQSHLTYLNKPKRAACHACMSCSTQGCLATRWLGCAEPISAASTLSWAHRTCNWPEHDQSLKEHVLLDLLAQRVQFLCRRIGPLSASGRLLRASGRRCQRGVSRRRRR